MSHKKAGGSTRNGRDSAGRRLGIKKFGGEIQMSPLYYFLPEIRLRNLKAKSAMKKLW